MRWLYGPGIDAGVFLKSCDISKRGKKKHLCVFRRGAQAVWVFGVGVVFSNIFDSV